MADKKPLYQPWNEDSFQSGWRVRGMNHVQRWMYKSLLNSAFFCQTSPYLPNDDKILWVLAGAESLDEWLRHKQAVIECFELNPDDSGLLSHHRVLEDWKRVTDYREKMRELSLKAAEVRRTMGGGSPHDDRADTGRTPHADQKKRKESIRNESEGEERKEPVLSLESYADKWSD